MTVVECENCKTTFVTTHKPSNVEVVKCPYCNSVGTAIVKTEGKYAGDYRLPKQEKKP